MRSFLWVIEMVAKTDIKFYVHTNNSAPQLNNNFGCMLNVLDAALINGIQVGTVSSLTALGRIVTAVFGTAHNLMQYQVIKIAGANQAEYNVEARILTVPNATTITLELATIPSVTIATGTINASLPSLGWEKPFSSVNGAGGGKGAYRSTNLLLPSRPFLRVVDELDPVWTSTYAKYAKVGIVEDMTGIDALLGVQAPYDSAAQDKNWVGTGSGTAALNGWAKWYYARSSEMNTNTNDSTAASAGNRSWILVGNSDYFYILPTTTAGSIASATYGFGSFKTLLNTDASNVFLSATLRQAVASLSEYKAPYTGISGTGADQKIVLQRGYNQAALYVDAKCVSLSPASAAVYSGSSNYIGQYSLTNISPFVPVFINETVLRGEIPNYYWLFQDKPYNNYTVLTKGNAAYIAVTAATATNVINGQVVLKIGDL